ncbi:MAG: hypothetical protein RIM80_22795, partial [Alphaproteobacteria bacterium]
FFRMLRAMQPPITPTPTIPTASALFQPFMCVSPVFLHWRRGATRMQAALRSSSRPDRVSGIGPVSEQS